MNLATESTLFSLEVVYVIAGSLLKKYTELNKYCSSKSIDDIKLNTLIKDYSHLYKKLNYEEQGYLTELIYKWYDHVKK